LKRIVFVLAISFALLNCNLQAQNHPVGHLLLIVPFENTSKVPGIDWIGESFPEVLGHRMASGPFFVIRREDRVYAFDRLGIPSNIRPSRATLLRIAEEMDVDYVVTGAYSFDGRSFTSRAQIMDVKKLKLTPQVVESGSLTQLKELQNALAWDLLRSLDPTLVPAKSTFLAATSPVRLDAFENYIRGVLATGKPERIKYFKEAVRLAPDYANASFELGKTYFQIRDYEQAINALARVPRTDLMASEANFYAGLAAFYLGQYDKAEEAFQFVASRIPLTEVYNNLGVVKVRRKKDALDFFKRTVQADSRDPDYRFNLALALYRAGDSAAAARQLREALALHPQDSEAKALLDSMYAGTGISPGGRTPMERVKRNYDETSYRQLLMEIQNAREMRAASLPPPEQSRYRVETGEQWLQQGANQQAETDFREAILLNPANASAHLGLARVLEQRNELAEAEAEAAAALRLEPSNTAAAQLRDHIAAQRAQKAPSPQSQ
jgi:tetratricopeptide (TPR) repeat protein/TolB-like protein